MNCRRTLLHGSLLLPGAALILAASAVVAFAEESFTWKEMPDIRQSLEMQSDQTRFPDLEPGVLRYIEFTETDGDSAGRTGYLTIRTGRQTIMTVFYFSPAGTATVLQRAMELNPRHQFSLTLLLPPSDEKGVVYVVFWETMPDGGTIEFVACNPYGAGKPIAGVLATATFGRSTEWASRQPWEDEFRLAGWNPRVTAGTGPPALVVRVDDDGIISSKDCTVSFSGRIETGYDEWGGLGRMLLSNPEQIRLRFELQDDQRFTQATLLVYGPASGAYGGTQDGLEAVVNSWSQIDRAPGEGPRPGMKQFHFEVSQYLEGGYNLIELRQPATASLYWPVERIELWLD